jgi:hypothetical protein
MTVSPPRREANGRKKRPSRADMDRIRQQMEERKRRQIMGVVLDQPHRRGNPDQRCENALGRFVLTHRLDRALYDAGQEFAGINRQLRRMIGLPGVYSNGPGRGYRADDADVADKIERLRTRLRDAKSAIRPRDYSTTLWLTLHAGPMDDMNAGDDQSIDAAKHGLLALAVHFGMTARR